MCTSGRDQRCLFKFTAPPPPYLLMAAWMTSNAPTRGVLVTGRPKEWGCACGMSEHKEEFMMWRNKAGRNHWKHLTRKLRACFCQADVGMTNASDRCLGHFFHLNKVTLIRLHPYTNSPGRSMQLCRTHKAVGHYLMCKINSKSKYIYCVYIQYIHISTYYLFSRCPI